MVSVNAEKMIQILQLEDFRIQVFRTRINIFVDCINLLSSKGQVSLLPNWFEWIELDDVDASKYKALLLQ